MKPKHHLILATIILLSAPLIFAQTGEVGTFVGTVSDTEGISLPGVEVTARNIQTGLTQSTVTNESGRYRIERLPRGFYELTAKLQGFKTTLRKGLELFSGAVTRVDLKMEMGTLQEEVTVIGATPIVETTRAEASTIMTEKELLSYPQQNRNYLHLMQYAPGTQPDAPIVGFGTGYAINGMRGESNNYMIDGLNNNDMTDNTMETTLLPPESIQEFRLITNNFNAEYGRNVGGVLNVVMKSGTNELHGSAWGFFRGDSAFFRSTDWLSGEREPYQRYQYGGTLGGPIIKDKTFFFITFEGINEEIDTVTPLLFLTPEAIATATGMARTFFDKYQSAYPIPTYDFSDLNGDGTADYGRANFAHTDKLKGYTGAIKIDHVFSERDRVAFRWMYNFRESQSEYGASYTYIPGLPEVIPTKFHTGGLTWLHIFSPSMYNEVRLGYHRDDWDWRAVDDEFPAFAFWDGLTPVGDAGYLMIQINNTYQLVDVLNIQAGDHNLKIGGELRYWTVDCSFDAYANGYYGYFNGLQWLNNDPVPIFIIGADPPDNEDNPYLPGDLTGEWKIGYGLTNRKWRGTEIGLFVQDDWRISDRLTISAGLRWEYYSVPEEYSGAGISQPAFGTEEGFETGQLIEGEWNAEGIRYTIFDGRELMGKGLWNSYAGSFAPKISIAYDLTGDGKTSLRAGYGISYDRQMNRSYENDRFNYPDFTFSGFWGIPFSPFEIYPTMPVQIPVEAAATGEVQISLRWMDPNLRPQMAHNWLVGIQRELGPNFSIEIDYTGSAGRRIGGIIAINRFTGDGVDGVIDSYNPFIAVASGNYRTNSFESNYHGLQVVLNKRFADGWSWYTAYTFGVAKDTGTSLYQGMRFSSIERWDLDYSYATYDHRHRVVGGIIWEIPFFRESESWFLRSIVGGWQIGTSFHWTSGRRFDVSSDWPGFDYNLDGFWYDRPLWKGGSDYQEVIKWDAGRPSLDESLFARPNPPAFEGDLSYYDQTFAPRNAFTWYPTYNIDISLQKNFIIPSGNRDLNLQLILDVFNLFKSQFWIYPPESGQGFAVNYGLPNFGYITRMVGDRIAQVSIRIMF